MIMDPQLRAFNLMNEVSVSSLGSTWYFKYHKPVVWPVESVGYGMIDEWHLELSMNHKYIVELH